MAKAPFPTDPELTAIAIAYHNKKTIADEVAPRFPVGKQEFKYLKHDMAQGFTVPDTKVGRKSKPNEVDFKAIEQTASTEDYGLDDPIPQADINNAPPNYDPKGSSVEYMTNLIELDREVRVANTTFNAANYAAANKVNLADTATKQFSDFTNSDPIETIMTALDAMVMRGNIAVIGRPAWSVISRNPVLLKARNRTSGDKGKIAWQEFAELFELDGVLIGEALVNTARKGQAASLARAWGKHMSLIYRDLTAGPERGLTYMLTAQWETRVSGSIPDPNIGLRGGERVRVGESVKEFVLATDLAYFLQNVVA